MNRGNVRMSGHIQQVREAEVERGLAYSCSKRRLGEGGRKPQNNKKKPNPSQRKGFHTIQWQNSKRNTLNAQTGGKSSLL